MFEIRVCIVCGSEDCLTQQTIPLRSQLRLHSFCKDRLVLTDSFDVLEFCGLGAHLRASSREHESL